MTENLPTPAEEVPVPQMRITLAADVPDEPEQEYTAVEMLLALTNGLRVRGVTFSLFHRGPPLGWGSSRRVLGPVRPVRLGT